MNGPSGLGSIQLSNEFLSQDTNRVPKLISLPSSLVSPLSVAPQSASPESRIIFRARASDKVVRSPHDCTASYLARQIVACRCIDLGTWFGEALLDLERLLRLAAEPVNSPPLLVLDVRVGNAEVF